MQRWALWRESPHRLELVMVFIKNLSIGMKIAISFVAVFAIFVASIFVSFSEFGAIKDTRTERTKQCCCQ